MTQGRFSCLDICACFCYDEIVIKANKVNNYMPGAARENNSPDEKQKLIIIVVMTDSLRGFYDFVHSFIKSQ